MSVFGGGGINTHYWADDWVSENDHPVSSPTEVVADDAA